MTLNRLSPELQKELEPFVQEVQERCAGNLLSIVLYGGAAKSDYT